MLEEMESQILKHIDKEDMLDLARQLTQIPSLTEEETAAARFMASYLSERGFEVELQEVEPGRFQTLATLKGSGSGRNLMFNGHLDIEPVTGEWPQSPYDPWVEGNRFYGAGIRNMKAGVVSMVHAADAIRNSGVKLGGDIVIAMVSGELQGGVGTRYLIEKGYRSDAAIVTEPYGAHYVVTQHGGMSVFSLHTFGRHPMGEDMKGVDAIEMMIKAIQAIQSAELTYKPWKVPGLPWVKIGSIIGGRSMDYSMQSPYRNADICTVLINVTTVPRQTAESVREDFEQALEAVKGDDPDFEYQMNHPPEREFKAWRMDFPPTDRPADTEIAQAVVQSYRDITGEEPKGVGLPASDLGTRYGDDDAHLWQAGIPSCLYGPGGGGYGVEYAYIDEMILCSQVLAVTAVRYCK